ncbi:MFS transporter [Actinacidiphila yeochonensis]|uniref:MFS transporter n=1 Tax=Actinacidiphila yeochonensis TaxID=89050 RepID=UPI00056355AE|nr:MFS transporter [Actinacidiphila yeochonensis]
MAISDEAGTAAGSGTGSEAGTATGSGAGSSTGSRTGTGAEAGNGTGTGRSTAGAEDAPRAAARARWAVTAVFFLNGMIISAWIARVPSFQANHHYGDGELGVILTSFGVAAIIAMQFVGALVGRLGSAVVIRLMLLGAPVLLACVGLSRNAGELAASLLLLGASHGTCDVAMSAHAVAVERTLKRPVMNGCHAAWGISAVLSSLIGAGSTHAGVSPGVQFSVMGAVLLLAAVPVTARLLPASTDRDTAAPDRPKSERVRTSWRDGWRGPVLVFGALGAILMVCEGAVNSWSGVFLHHDLGATLAAASLGYTAYVACQSVGRLVGDRLNRRFAAVVLFRTSAVIGLLGLAVAILVPFRAAAIAGFGILGIGAALPLPMLFSAAGHAGGEGPGAAVFVSRFTTFTYGGVLLGPAVVGWCAEAFTLHWTLAALIPLMALVAFNARIVARPEEDRGLAA